MKNTGQTFNSKSIWSVELNHESNNLCIFSNNGANQTGNLPISGDKLVYNNGTWLTLVEAGLVNWESTENGIAVLNGTKIMVYAGELNGWNQANYYFMSENNTNNKVATANLNIAKTIGSDEYKIGVTTLSQGTYYQGHWASGLQGEIHAGGTYIVRGTISASGYTPLFSNSNVLYSYDAGSTKTVTTTISHSVQQGSNISITTSTAAGKSSLGLPNTIKYYLFDGSNYSELTVTDGSADVSALSVGSGYKVITVLYDGNIYVKADENNFEVISSSTPSHNITYTEQSTGWTYGATPASQAEDEEVSFVVSPTAGYTVNVSVTSGEVELSREGNTYSFTMGTSDVEISVNATENKYTVTIAAGTNGDVSSTNVFAYPSTKSAEITATPNNGYDFVNWDLPDGVTAAEGYTATSNPIKINATAADKTITANFRKTVAIYVLKTLASGYSTPGDVTFASHTSYKLWAWDNSGEDKFNLSMTGWDARPSFSEEDTDAMGNEWYLIRKNNPSCGNYTFIITNTADTKIFTGNEGTPNPYVNGRQVAPTKWFDADSSVWVIPSGVNSKNSAHAYTKNPIAVRYRLTYDGNDATFGTAPASKTYAADSEVTVENNNTGKLRKTGYIFAGWNTAADGSGTDYAASDIVTMTEDITLYAQWDEASTTTIYFKQPDPAWDYVMAHVWEAANTGNHISNWNAEASKITTTITRNCETYYQISIPEPFDRIKFHKDDSPQTSDLTIDPETPVYVFGTGWTTLPAENIWHITYNANGADSGTAPTDAIDYSCSSNEVTVADNTGDLAKDGQSFFGWNTSADGSGTTHIAGSHFTISEDVTLYAKFVSGTQYTITYDVLNGNGTLSADYTAGGNIGASPAAVSEHESIVITATPTSGYQVYAWYRDAEMHDEITSDISMDKLSYTINDVTANQSVYVRFYAPADITGITIRNATNDNIVNGEVITATPVVTPGKGDKAYCWAITKDEQPVVTSISSASQGAIRFTINEAGTYKLHLTIHSDGACDGPIDDTFEQSFTVYANEWYMVGARFWGTDASSLSALTPSSQTTHGVNIFFQQDQDGNYYFGPFQFTKNSVSEDYQHFRVYNKGKNKQYVAESNGNFVIRSTNDYYDMEHAVTLKEKTDITFEAQNMSSTNHYIYIRDGKLWVSKDLPQLALKARIKAVCPNMGESHNVEKTYYSNEVDVPETGQSDIISFYAATNATLYVEKFVLGTGWTTTNICLNAYALESDNNKVYTAVLSLAESEGEMQHIAIENLSPYAGQYYIRSKVAGGGMNNYLTDSDNRMNYSEYLLQKNGFDYYYCNWVTGKDIRFQIANDYNAAISEYFTQGDDVVNNPANLPQNANIRFMWNSTRNDFARAYISGSTNVADRFLVLEGDEKIRNADGSALTAHNGLAANEMHFKDLGNWIYQADIQAQTTARVKLTAKYNNKIQYFIGANGERSESTTEEIVGGSSGEFYPFRVTYDFKTNRLVTAWLADGEVEVSTDEAINADVMVVRNHQGAATQINFSGDGSKLSGVKTVYGVMQFDKTKVNDGSKSRYERDLYWVSFPFDVQLSEVFGFGKYGQHWIIEYYDGAGRAANGFWVDSDPNWKFVMPNQRKSFTLQANVGYILALDLDELGNSSPVWAHTSRVSLYFPSSSAVATIDGVLPQGGSFDVPEHRCTITRCRRDIKDSNWNVIGVPSYANVTKHIGEGSLDPVYTNDPLELASTTTLPFIYKAELDATNSMTPVASEDFTFEPMHAYLVQYAGTLDWNSANFNGTVVSPAPKRAATSQATTLRLDMLTQGEKTDQTFIRLTEDATEDFDMNQDLTKMFKQNANIYSIIEDSIEAAANNLPLQGNSITIPLGVKVSQEGIYSFALATSESEFFVYLVDYEQQIETNLLFDNYEATISAGTNDQRFALRIAKTPSVATDLENNYLLNQSGAIKYLEDGHVVILVNDRKFSATGQLLK